MSVARERSPASSLSIRIQHHPSRSEILLRLLAPLVSFEDVAVVPDPDPDAPANAWRAHRACLEAMPEDATHLLVLQDDAVILSGFEIAVARVQYEQPEALVILFTPGFRWLQRLLQEAKRQGDSYARISVGAFVPTVAILYPRAVVEGLLAWAKRREPPYSARQLQTADDGVLATYCRARRLHPLATVPPVVDHDDTVESVGRRMRQGPHRRAAVL